MRSSVDTACSGSSEEIKIGAGVLDYIIDLGIDYTSRKKQS